jgi:hypothetical protein
MSNWVRGRVTIKDLVLFKEIAEKMGLKVKDGKNMSFRSSYAGTVKADMILSDGQGGKAALVQTADGDYQTVIDSHMNSITGVVGHNCAMICREYTTMKAKEKALIMGGVLTSEQVLNDGRVQLRVSI